MRLLFFWVLAIGPLVAGAPSRNAHYVVHERRAVEPVNWVKTRRLEAHKSLTVRIGLAQQNLHELEETLMSVAHPDSQKYGQHWSPERVAEYFAPSETTVSMVKSWLMDAGFHPERLYHSRSKGWITVKADVSEAESLLKAEYYLYTHPSGRKQIGPCGTPHCAIHVVVSDLLAIGCEFYSVPEDVREHVDLIRPTVHFSHHVHGDQSESSEHSDTTLNKAPLVNNPISHVPKDGPSLNHCDKYTTPQCLRMLYSIDYKPKLPQLNSFGIGVYSFVKFSRFC